MHGWNMLRGTLLHSKVCAHVVAYTAGAYTFRQVPVQVISNDIEEAEKSMFNVQSISGKLDTNNCNFLQPLSTFSKAVIGISNIGL